MKFLYLMILVDYMVFGSKKNCKKDKNSIETTSSTIKSKGRVEYLRSVAIYIKGYNSLRLRIKNLKEMNYIANLYSKKYVSKILSDKNLLNVIYPRLIGKINQYDQSVFERDNKKIYIFCCLEIHNVLREQKNILFHNKFDLITNLFFDKIFDGIENINISNIEEMEKNIRNYIFQIIEYHTQKIIISTKKSEFTRSFIKKLNEIDSYESRFIKAYIFNILLEFLCKILNYFEDYQNASILLEKKNSEILSFAQNSNGQIIFIEIKCNNANFLEDGQDNVAIYNEIGKLIIEASTYLPNDMIDIDFSNKIEQKLIFDGFDTYNIFELNPYDTIETVKKNFIAFLKSNITKKFKRSKEIIQKPKIYLVIDFNNQIIQFSELFLSSLNDLKSESSLDRSKSIEKLNDLNYIKENLNEKCSSFFDNIGLILNILSPLVKEIDKNVVKDYELYLVFENLAKVDLENIIKKNISDSIRINFNSEKIIHENACNKKKENVKNGLISIFILILRDSLDIKCYNKSPKISLKIENFSNEMSLVDSLKAII